MKALGSRLLTTGLDCIAMERGAVGMYFIVRCTARDCKLRGRDAAVYVGLGEFDFVREQRLCVCGSCSRALSEVLNVVFVGCCWSSRGLLDAGTRMESQEKTAEPVALFPAEWKLRRWRWLKFAVTASPATAVRATETQTETGTPDLVTGALELLVQGYLHLQQDKV